MFKISAREPGLSNHTPADVYFCRGQASLNSSERTKRDTIQNRRLQYRLELA